MQKKIKHPLSKGDIIKFQINNEIEKGEAEILGMDFEYGGLGRTIYNYRIKVLKGDYCKGHRNTKNGQLWIWDREVKKIIRRCK